MAGWTTDTVTDSDSGAMDQEGRREQYSILEVPNIAWIDGKGAPPHNDGLVLSSLSLHSTATLTGTGTSRARGKGRRVPVDLNRLRRLRVVAARVALVATKPCRTA